MLQKEKKHQNKDVKNRKESVVISLYCRAIL